MKSSEKKVLNRTALEEIIAIAVQLGVAQGRRIVKHSLEWKLLELEAAIGRRLEKRFEELDIPPHPDAPKYRKKLEDLLEAFK